MLTFRIRGFMILVAFCAVVLAGVTVGVRWTFYRVEVAIYARQELEHTFDAANFRRASRRALSDPDIVDKAAAYKRLALAHEKAARDCARIRVYYETCW